MPTFSEMLHTNVGRYLDKVWDWHAFPSNEGYAELERAQMRYIGSGGSPKADSTSLTPGAFSCSLIHQEPGRKASTHHHQVEELFFVHEGRLTMSWQFGDETIDFELGPGEAVLNPSGQAHGFRNEGPENCVIQIMVATAAPMLPTYTDHPSEHPVSPLRAASGARRAEYMAATVPYVARIADAKPIVAEVEGGRFIASPYVMAKASGGLIEPPHFTFAFDRVTRGARTPAYALEAEEAIMVVEGVLDVELGEGAERAVTRLNARDLVLVPAGVTRRIINNDAGTVRFASIVGSPRTQPIAWNADRAMAIAQK